MRFFTLFYLGCLISYSIAPLARADETSGGWRPYQDFPAADFTRGERPPTGEFSLGAYTHYQRFDNVASPGTNIDGASEIHNTRWVPVLFLDYQATPKWRINFIMHSAVVETDLIEAGTGARRTDSIGGLTDIFLIGVWSPFMNGEPPKEKYHFLDYHNLSFAFGPKFDLSSESDLAGVVPGGVLLRTGTGAHDFNIGMVYTGDVNDKIWMYYFAQGTFPLSDNNFGFKPGISFSNKIGASWVPNHVLQLFLEVEFASQARGAGGTIPAAIVNSGGQSLKITPGLTADIGKGWGIELSGAIPVHSWLNGEQPDITLDIFFGFYKAFDFKKVKSTPRAAKLREIAR